MYTGHAVFPFQHNWSEELMEFLEWKTDVLSGQTGREQRVSRRLSPRRSFEASFLLDKDNFRAFNTFFERYSAGEFILPLWQDVRRLIIGNPGDTLSFDVSVIDSEFDTATFIVLRDPQWHSWEPYLIVSTLDYTVTVSNNGLTAVDRPWPSNTRAYPGMLVRFEGTPTVEKITDQNTRVRVRFTSARPVRHPSDPTFDEYGTQPVLMLRPDESGSLSHGYERSLSVVDNSTGLVLTYDNFGRPVRTMEYRWSVVGGENLKELRSVLHWLRGRTKSLLVPTFMEDLKAISPAVSGASTLVVSNVGYAQHQMHTRGREKILVELRDGTTMFREVTAAAATTDTTDTLTLDTAWAYDIPVASIARISFLIPCRLDQDSVEISHPTDTVGVSHCKVTWREVLGEVGSYEGSLVPTAEWRAEMATPALPSYTDLGTGVEDIPAEIFYMEYIEEIDRVVLVSWANDGVSWGNSVSLLFPDTLELDEVLLPALQGLLLDQTQNHVESGVYVRWRTVVYSKGYLVFCGYYEPGPEWSWGYLRIHVATGTWTFFSESRAPLPPGVEWAFSEEFYPGYTISTRAFERIWVNPHDGDIYAYAYEAFGGLIRFDVEDMSVAKQVYVFYAPYADPRSEFGDYYSPLHYTVADDGVIFDVRDEAAVFISDLFFADERTAYMQDRRTGGAIVPGWRNDLYRIDLSTGVAKYQFTTYPVAETRQQSPISRAVAYDELTNTLWFSAYGGVFAWLVGSPPETLRYYIGTRDRTLRPHGTNGLQAFAYPTTSHIHHKQARKLWELVVSYLGVSDKAVYDGVGEQQAALPEFDVRTRADAQPRMDGRSLDTRLVDSVMFPQGPSVATVFNPSNVLTYPVSPIHSDVQFVSPTLGWEFRTDWTAGVGEVRRFIRFELVGSRPPPPFVRFVRVTILANRHWRATNAGATPSPYTGGATSVSPGYVGLQGLELHRTPNGRPLPIAGITASSSDSGYPASNLINGNYVDPESSWRSSGETYPKTITVELAEAARVSEVMLWPVNSREDSPSLYGTGLYRKMGPETAPDTFNTEVSVDGVTWINLRQYYGMEGGWAVSIDGMPEAYLALPPESLPDSGATQFAYESVFLSGPQAIGGSPSAGRAFDVY